MKVFIIEVIGLALIFGACDIGTPEEYHLDLFTGPWLLRMGLIILGSLILKHSEKI